MCGVSRRQRTYGFESQVRKSTWKKEMETHSNILAWKIPWKEEPGRLQSKESNATERLNWTEIHHENCGLRNVDWKKDAQCESFKLGFIWGQNNVCSLGDSTSDSSEKLFQKGSGGRSIYVILVKGKFMQSSTYFTKVFLLVKRGWCHHERI